MHKTSFKCALHTLLCVRALFFNGKILPPHLHFASHLAAVLLQLFQMCFDFCGSERFCQSHE